MAEKTLQEKFDELSAHQEGVIASLGTLQTKLDDALQREVDTNAAHEASLKLLREQSAAVIQDLRGQLEAEKTAHESAMLALQTQCQATVKAAQDACAATLDAAHKEAEAIKAKCLAGVEQYRLAHEQAVAILSESPAARELRLKQTIAASELARQHELERQQLTSGVVQ